MKSALNRHTILKELDLLAERLTTGGINDRQQIDFCWLIRGACRRPEMYVGKHSFELLATFLVGYDHALELRLLLAGMVEWRRVSDQHDPRTE
jgi:hypothetical protein